MATNPALVARPTLVAEEPWKTVLRLPHPRELPPEWFKYPPI